MSHSSNSTETLPTNTFPYISETMTIFALGREIFIGAAATKHYDNTNWTTPQELISTRGYQNYFYIKKQQPISHQAPGENSKRPPGIYTHAPPFFDMGQFNLPLSSFIYITLSIPGTRSLTIRLSWLPWTLTTDSLPGNNNNSSSSWLAQSNPHRRQFHMAWGIIIIVIIIAIIDKWNTKTAPSHRRAKWGE